jgi:queuine tRNA-ribosyltransferase
MRLNHGEVETPIFMPVGTYGAVKAMSAARTRGHRRADRPRQHLPPVAAPGLEVIRAFGGLHAFNGWHKPILTDSGGFQVFSLGDLRKISEEGVRFRRRSTATGCCSPPRSRCASSACWVPTSR